MADKLNLKGTWTYQSFLLLPTDVETDAPPGASVTARKWAKGQLIVPEDTTGELSGELVFAPGVTLRVTGQILPATDSTATILQATGKGIQGFTEGAIYEITGWIIFTSSQDELPTIHGSVLAVRGPNTSPNIELGKMPINTVGAFTLAPS